MYDLRLEEAIERDSPSRHLDPLCCYLASSLLHRWTKYQLTSFQLANITLSLA